MLFILLGYLLIPYAGIQTDEALFSQPFYSRGAIESSISIFKHKLPTMIMTYVGALKTWIYAPIYAIWTPSVWSTRLPMVIVGGITVGLFFLLIQRVGGRRAAIAGAFLLATEPTYLMTTTFDWGPVALQILLITGALFAAASGKFRWMGFLLGLAMWNKAIFSWSLAGLAVAAVVVYGRELWRAVRTREAVMVGVMFALGALPLIQYNIRKPLNTFKSNTKLAFANIDGKYHHFELAANGSGLLGYITGEEWMDNPKAASCPVARAGGELRDRIGEKRKTFGLYAFYAAILLAPLWWRVRRPEAGPLFDRVWRPMVFSLVYLAVAWLLMAMTEGAGGAAHHAILLWPFPIIVVVVGLSAALRPAWLFGAVAGVLVLMNLLVVNQYQVQFARNGTTGAWSDAIFGLAKELPKIPAKHVYLTDWGMSDSLSLLTQGRVPQGIVSDPLMHDPPSEQDRQFLDRWLAEPDSVFVTHTEGYEEYKGNAKRLAAYAEASGYRRELLATVPDANGRPVFEVARFVRDPR